MFVCLFLIVRCLESQERMRSEILISFLGCSSICFNLSITSLNLDKLLCPSAFCFFLSFVCHVQTSEFFEALQLGLSFWARKVTLLKQQKAGWGTGLFSIKLLAELIRSNQERRLLILKEECTYTGKRYYIP